MKPLMGYRRRDLALSDVARHVILPEGIVTTAWPTVRDTNAIVGVRFDGWQDGFGKAALGKRKDGSYAASVGGVALSSPRQIGKTFLMGRLLVGLCLATPGMAAMWSAHRVRTSANTFKSMVAMTQSPQLSALMLEPRRANGQEAIQFKNGSIIAFGARESGFGRGLDDISVVVFDEAQILTDKAIDAMLPTANVAKNPMMFYLGTPPRPDDPSEVFTRIRKDALSGEAADTMYVEFSADEDADLDDRNQWARANPGFPYRTPESAYLRMRKQMSQASFRREALGIWDKEVSNPLAIPAKAWGATFAGAGVDLSGTVCFGVRFSTDGSTVAIGAAVRDGRKGAIIDGVLQAPVSEGVGNVLAFLTDRDRLGRTAQIIVDGKSGAAYLIDQLRAAGVPARVIIAPAFSDVIAASAMMLNGIVDGSVSHVENTELDAQASSALFRKIGSQGGFGWAAPEGASVALLEAATLALWGIKTTKRRPKGARKAGGGVRIL